MGFGGPGRLGVLEMRSEAMLEATYMTFSKSEPGLMAKVYKQPFFNCSCMLRNKNRIYTSIVRQVIPLRLHLLKPPKLCVQCLIPVGLFNSPSLPSYPKLSESPPNSNAHIERRKDSRSSADAFGSIDGESNDPGAMSPRNRSRSFSGDGVWKIE
jgi:hypothetical protein